MITKKRIASYHPRRGRGIGFIGSIDSIGGFGGVTSVGRIKEGAVRPSLATVSGIIALLTPMALGIVTREAGAAEPDPNDSVDAYFLDATQETGLDFYHVTAATGRYFFPEITGAGGALLDYDSDGDLDLYLVQGNPVDPATAPEDFLFEPVPNLPASDRLFRNDLGLNPEGRLVTHWLDVTAQARIAPGGIGMGVTVGDIDNDGHPDLYITNYGPNRMLRNRGDGTFEDVTQESGTDDPRWSVAATFIDYDRDGGSDLFVTNYVDFTPAKQIPCFGNTGARDYCGPDTYPHVSDRLFRNLGESGNGRFEDVTGAAGFSGRAGAALGVAAADFDRDGWPDLFVANDGVANFLWINNGDGTFSEDAMLRGSALNAEGSAEASMGVAVADIDGDGDEDLLVSHLERETNTLYLNDGHGMFEDGSLRAGVGLPSWKKTGFGTCWVDFDLDGRLDLWVVNGAVTSMQSLLQARDPYPFHQPNLLFHHRADGSFADVSSAAGAGFEMSDVSRGALIGDVDNDGDPDLLTTNNNGPARLLMNRFAESRRWIGLQPALSPPAFVPEGVRVTLSDATGIQRRRSVRTSSYASAIDPRVVFGQGAPVNTDTSAAFRADVDVEWLPATKAGGGRRQRFHGLTTGRYWIVPPPGWQPEVAP